MIIIYHNFGYWLMSYWRLTNDSAQVSSYYNGYIMGPDHVFTYVVKTHKMTIHLWAEVNWKWI